MALLHEGAATCRARAVLEGELVRHHRDLCGELEVGVRCWALEGGDLRIPHTVAMVTERSACLRSSDSHACNM